MIARGAAAILLASPLGGAGPAAPPAAATARPSLFVGADPAPLVVGREVWIYPTGVGGTRLVAWSSRGGGAWAERGELLRVEDVRWIPDGAPRHGLWAPHMAAANGRYYLYFSVGPQEPTASRLGVAVCRTPAGPCRDSGRPLVDGSDSDRFPGRPAGCVDGVAPTGSGRFRFEAIDPMVFVDPASGRRLLYAGGSNGATMRVWELAPDMVTVAREVAVDQPPCFTEGPWMHRWGGTYHLTYSSGNYDRSNYSVRHATAPTPTGPWTYRGAILRSGGDVKGPGHHGLFRDPRTGGWMIAYHRWEGVAGDGPYRNARRRVALASLRHRADGTIEPVSVGGR